MGLLERFKQSKGGVNLPDTDPTESDDNPFDSDTAIDDDPFDSQPDTFNDLDTTTNTDPGINATQSSDDGLRQDVKLILERLDTIKSQLQSVQHRLDNLENKSSNSKSW